MTWSINCPDCGTIYVVGKRCACFPPLPQPGTKPVKARRRRVKGTVKATVLTAFRLGFTVPMAARASGISAWTLYNAARRLGIKLKSARK
jgi:hypothetical protein